MIDEKKSKIFKLKTIEHDSLKDGLNQFLIEGECILGIFKNTRTIRDQVVFTNKRIIIASSISKGILPTAMVDFTSLPYSKINIYSIESSGTSEDCKVGISLNDIGSMKFEISGTFDFLSFNKAITQYALA